MQVWAICKSAPCSRQTITPAPHHSCFYSLDALPATQPTASKHYKAFSEWQTIKTTQNVHLCICDKTDKLNDIALPLAAVYSFNFLHWLCIAASCYNFIIFGHNAATYTIIIAISGNYCHALFTKMFLSSTREIPVYVLECFSRSPTELVGQFMHCVKSVIK